MRSRWPEHKNLDYCFNPLRIEVRENEFEYVPCGKCDGCVLHKANDWAMRLANEIEDARYSIFATFTYMNDYLPVLTPTERMPYSGALYRREWHTNNFITSRWNGKDYVPRDEYITLNGLFESIAVTNWSNTNYPEVIPYSSKRDFQLYLKLLRKDIYEQFKNKSVREREIRYFAISEYGETLLRPHIHAIFFTDDPEISEYLAKYGLYKSWKMSDQTLFQKHCNFCNSGASGYLTQYVTSCSNLPTIYRLSDFRPWRLASKNPAIGFRSFKKTEVFENISSGSIEYSRTVPRIDARYLLRYPKAFGSSIFPKCKRFSELDFHGLLRVYGKLCRLNKRYSKSFFDSLLVRLRAVLPAQDYRAAQVCMKYFPHTPFHYVYLLDTYYYGCAMAALRSQYEYQEKFGFTVLAAMSYNNFRDYVISYVNGLLPSSSVITLNYFVVPLGVPLECVSDIDFSEFCISDFDKDYRLEVSDILSDMVKMPKFNEKIGSSPNSIIN